ncbi:MAG TPA: isoprenylcysteine carboxylmethyltransferase family protein [Rhizomicrobium sp.]|jgi:protein-S-isoprenylcysteine O-methyltransferase Ste14|nr:isoprenylcysteine carboxylmethyltransferase family protein [Rhizomicrobium sp.]
MTPQIALNYLWAFWVLSWLAAALWSAPSAKRPVFGSEILYRVVTLLGAALLFGVTERRAPMRLSSFSESADWALFGVCVGAFVFCWWARIHLGRLWSAWVSKKQGHRIIDTGPYRVVRHPIYTGLILAALATAAMKGTSIALGGAAIMAVGFWIKARLEERFLCQELGAEAYSVYRRRVPMLIPLGPKSA